jgi:hypothetical protein
MVAYRLIVTVSETETKRRSISRCLLHQLLTHSLVDATGTQTDRMAKLRNQQEVRIH